MKTVSSPDPLIRDEHELIRNAQQGDRTAFDRLVKFYWDGLFRWLFHLTHDRHAAEDIAQETFLKVFQGLGHFQLGTNFRAWLFRIAHNTYVNSRRGKRRALVSFPREWPGREEDPAACALNRESMILLARAVGRLPTDFRAAFVLRAEQGLSFREIGEVLAIPEETARWRVFKARQKLMRSLASQREGENHDGL